HIYALSLHDALPISPRIWYSRGLIWIKAYRATLGHPTLSIEVQWSHAGSRQHRENHHASGTLAPRSGGPMPVGRSVGRSTGRYRSEEHRSELQSREK